MSLGKIEAEINIKKIEKTIRCNCSIAKENMSMVKVDLTVKGEMI